MNSFKLSLLISLTLVLSCTTKNWTFDNHHEFTFDDYVAQFGRQYSDENEYSIRKVVFEENMKKIEEINSNERLTWKAGVNHMTDLLAHEIESKRGYKRIVPRGGNKATPFRNLRSKSFSDFPESLDYRDQGVVNPPKNQGACGSCWAFSAVSVLESQIALSTGKLLDLSEQQVVDCAPNPHHCGGTGGCEGSDQPLAFDYFRAVGAVLSSEYPYHQQDETCKDQEKTIVATAEGFHLIPDNDPYALMEALVKKGPLSVSVDATNWHLYHSGIVNGDCGAASNHAVVLVGYGADEQGKYWIVRNSWGPEFGEDGYIRIHREDDPLDVVCYVDNSPSDGSACDNGPTQLYVCGTCALYFGSSFPEGVKLLNN